MTSQEIFDQVAKHLLTQNAKSIGVWKSDRDWSESNSRCFYRGPEGRKCAVGCLIPDEEYDPELEMGINKLLDSDSILETRPVLASLKEHRVFLHELQNIHDNYEPDVWRQMLREFAQRAGLSDAVLDQVE